MLRRVYSRRRSGPGAWLVLLGLAAALVIALRPDGRGVDGGAYVVDGDSLRIDGVDIRLKGVDAPEMRQTCSRAGRPYGCGEHARRALEAKIGGRPLACRVEGRDRYRRSLARCRLDGEDLGAWLVREGLAVGYRDYEPEEAAARARRAGLWAGEFQNPGAWRQEHPRS
jgi:endonuclease YncB( thermonuclease family)